MKHRTAAGRRRRRSLRAIATGGLLVLLVAAGLLLSYRVDVDSLRITPQPVASYEAALARARTLQGRDTEAVNQVCRSIVLDHERRVERSIVLYHGFTNCPEQFRPLGEAFFEQGYNVVIPRLPRHGLQDRLTDDLSSLTARELVQTTADAVEIAAGLGEQITTIGLSGGGVLAAWAALHEPRVTTAVLVAPGFCPKPAFGCRLEPLIGGLSLLPDRYVWWSAEKRERLMAPPYAYPRFSTRAAFEFSKVGIAVERAIEAGGGRGQPKLVLVTIENDEVISNDYARATVDRWAAKQGLAVSRFEFPATAGLEHDIIDPYNEKANVALVYPSLIQLSR